MYVPFQFLKRAPASNRAHLAVAGFEGGDRGEVDSRIFVGEVTERREVKGIFMYNVSFKRDGSTIWLHLNIEKKEANEANEEVR